MTWSLNPPVVRDHRGIKVVRDDLSPGGTKARYVAEAFEHADVVSYASPCEGGAQVALAFVAKQLGKKAVIICANRRVKHRRTCEAARLGAEIVELDGMTRWNVVQSRARSLSAVNGWTLAPFGLETQGAVSAIRDAALATDLEPDEVWSVASSGVLARGLAAAWPLARQHVVQTGHRVTPGSACWATVHVYPKAFREAVRCDDFPSDPHYDAKAWEVCVRGHGNGVVVFWNVLGY